MTWLQKISGDVFRMQDYQDRITLVVSMLRKFDFNVASGDVTVDNYNAYAQWLLDYARNKSVLINPETRERFPQPKWEEVEQALERAFKLVGIVPEVGEHWLS